MDLELLNNVTPLTFNTTMFENGKELVPALVETTNTYSDGYFGLMIMLVVYLYLIYTLFRDDGDMKLDIVKSSLKASGFSSIIGIIMLVTGLVSSYVHIVWFLSIFLISLIASYFLKRKNQ